MSIMHDIIKPYIGTEVFKLGANIDDIKFYLKQNRISFVQNIEPNKGCVPEEPWTFFEIDRNIKLCFVKKVLFEIVFENKYLGRLENGITIGIPFSQAMQIDETLEYNDDDEDYISQHGYWLEDDLENGNVSSITVFLPDVNEDDFFTYEWVKKYIS